MAGLSWLTGLGLMLALISCTATKNVPAATVTATLLPSLKTFATNTATPIPTSAVEKFDSNSDDLVSEEKLCPASVPFDNKLISSGSILAQNNQSKTDNGYVLIDPRTGQVDRPANWEWTRNQGEYSTVGLQVPPDKSSILFTYTYPIPDKAGYDQQDWLVYGNNLELIARRTFEGFDRNVEWLDNKQVLYYDNNPDSGPPSQHYFVWDPATNQQVDHKLIVSYVDLSNREKAAPGIDFDPSLNYAVYEVPGEGNFQVSDLRNKKIIWSDVNNKLVGYVWSPNGQKLSLLMRDKDRVQLDILSPGNSLEHWVDIEQAPSKRDSSWIPHYESWSSNSRYLAFTIDDGELYLLDFQKKVLTHTCISSVDKITWSPDSRQILLKSSGQFSILDMTNMEIMPLSGNPWSAYSPLDWVAIANNPSSYSGNPTPTTIETTPTAQPTINTTPPVYQTRIAPKDRMKQVFVPAGSFQMGSEAGYKDANPEHTVELDDYWFDQTEVTNGMYNLCVKSGNCTPPVNPGSQTRENYYNDPEYLDYPVIYVNWYQADAYCRWVGRSLPTEAQWEKAARGTDGRTFPWGEHEQKQDELPDNYFYSSDDTNRVGLFPSEASPYGALDMVSYVSEWVADWYDPNFYANSPLHNPQRYLYSNSGANDLLEKVLRGGGPYMRMEYLRSFSRSSYLPVIGFPNFGFRCASNPPEIQAAMQASATAAAQQIFTNLVTPTPVFTSEPTSSNNSPNSNIIRKTASKDGMVLDFIPAGPFPMGSEKGSDDEKPVHNVTLDAYWIDQTLVTNAMYMRCVNEGVCNAPIDSISYTRGDYYRKSQYKNYPVIYVDWDRANIYCKWAGRHLPSEAEWEKAARGTDGRDFPWGNQPPNPNLLNYNFNMQDTTQVDRYLAGAGPYGTLDMAGNVLEWIADDNATHFLRGGAWNENWAIPSYSRIIENASWDYNTGFRCAVSDSQVAVSNSAAQTTQTAKPLSLSAGTKRTSDKDGMDLLFVPAGKFIMGLSETQKQKAIQICTQGGKTLAECEKWIEPEQPAHTVNLDDFWIDHTEVTNSMYKKCYDAGACKGPGPIDVPNTTYITDPYYADDPAIFITWYNADDYCKWAGRSLPTEAQWEKAARGTDGRTYPWGEGIDPSRANYEVTKSDDCNCDSLNIKKVGSYPKGASPYGALDMAGNVSEWVADYYDEFFYQKSPNHNPFKAEPGWNGDETGYRGGSWLNSPFFLRSSDRGGTDLDYSYKDTGFRCATTQTPP